MDPAGYDADDWPVLSLAYDGLVAYRRVPGAGGSTIVPDLAGSIPEPTDGGRTYTFQLRPGLRFSDGAPVRPEDFRASIERVVRLAGQIVPYYSGIVGGAGCTARKCDLSKGIETDAAARTIVIHLGRPDPEFLHKLAIPMAAVLPSRTPATMIRGRPPPGTGPYTITEFAAKTGARLVRNARFRSWSADARPDGFPDRIAVTAAPGDSAQVAAVRAGRADAVVAAGNFSGTVPVDQGRALALGAANRVVTAPEPFVTYLFLNTREPPFDDVRVRRAVNYAVDRRRMVALAGGSGEAGLTCQLIPPGLPGYVPTCPFTLAPTRGGGWRAPDLARARRLVAASGSRGARVGVFVGPRYAGIGRYTGAVLRQLGYRVRVRVFPDVESSSSYIADSRHHVQIGITGWVDDFLTSSSFFDPLTCRLLIPRSSANNNQSQYCHPAIDAAADAALAAHGTVANTRWAALDRRVLADAPTVPLFSRRALLFVSDRVGNPKIHPLLGPLLEQFWVR
jgi:peptide/nickel transport system substrate-binding protein